MADKIHHIRTIEFGRKLGFFTLRKLSKQLFAMEVFALGSGVVCSNISNWKRFIVLEPTSYLLTYNR